LARRAWQAGCHAAGLQGDVPKWENLRGQDRTDTLNYFGSASSRLIERDFTEEERRDFTIRKQVLWQDPVATPAEVTAVELRFILGLRANEPEVGYNQWPGRRRRKLAVDSC